MSEHVRGTKYARDAIKLVKPLIYSVGADYRIENAPGGNGHMRLIITFQGKERFTLLPGTPNNPDKILKKKYKDVKLVLTELGAIKL